MRKTKRLTAVTGYWHDFKYTFDRPEDEEKILIMTDRGVYTDTYEIAEGGYEFLLSGWQIGTQAKYWMRVSDLMLNHENVKKGTENG